MTVEEAQNMLMKAFEMKIMPDMSQTPTLAFHPLQRDFVDINKWKWSNYPLLHTDLEYHKDIKAQLK